MSDLCGTVSKPFCKTAILPVLSLRRPLRATLPRSRLVTQLEYCGCRRAASKTRTTASAAQQSSQSPSAKLVRQSPPKQSIVLPRSQLANKQVVTRTDGQILGVVDELLTDPNTFKVVVLNCKPSPNMLAGDVPRQVGLMSLKQISDVLLVHDERALLKQPLTVGLGYVKLVGIAVKTADGKLLGKVRDFLFSPDDGRIVELVIDALGIPAIPQRLLGTLSVRTQLVQNISWNSVTLSPGAEPYVDKTSLGAFDGAVELLKSVLRRGAWSDPEVAERREDPAYAEWYLMHGQAYEQQNKQAIQQPSEAALQTALQALRMQQPQALPPGRQPSYDSQLQPQAQSQYQSQLEYQQAEPELAGTFSPQQAQQAFAVPQQQPSPYSKQAQESSDDLQWQQQQQQRPSWQQPALPQLQQQWPPSGSGNQSQVPPPQQRQQPPAGQQATYQGQAASQRSGSPNKIQQQRRYAARVDAPITEPRFDPRRRKPAPGLLSPGAPLRSDAVAASKPQTYSQPRSGEAAAGRLSYTPQRGGPAQSSQGGGSSQPVQQEEPRSRGAYQQQAGSQARQQFANGRDVAPGSNGSVNAVNMISADQQEYQSRQSRPADRSFESWADVSPQSVQPVTVMSDGTVESA